jgi:hypothetical protein
MQALHMVPTNPVIRFFLGRLQRLLKNPLASVFFLLSALSADSMKDETTRQELCSVLAYYRSEYIRLRTDLLSGMPMEALSEAHDLLNTRLFVYCLLYATEICIMNVGVRDIDYVTEHLRIHFAAMMENEEAPSLSSLMYTVLICILVIEMTISYREQTSGVSFRMFVCCR